ncbi:MAG TPA: hypothetical protein VK988_19025 [Acidimicrobiales bacterium]|nr:hypothetical protein [Acidimicrobiales bacterium]
MAPDEGWLSSRFTAAEVDAVKAGVSTERPDLEWRVPDRRPPWWRRVVDVGA